MSDTKECCVFYEPTEHLTPCNHLVCEFCFPRLNTCPMCRALLGNGVPPMEVSGDELNLGMAMAAEHLTPRNHLVCESCYSQVPTCPMCRAPFNNEMEDSSDDDDNS